MTQRNYCFDIEPMWGSHSAVLESALAQLEPGSLVIEHGAGMYSGPVIARYPVRVLCIEEAPGWTAWSKWLYQKAEREVSFLSRAKQAIPRLSEASLVFIDGASRERADLLKWALAANVPCIIAHDTQDETAGTYNYQKQLFSVAGYDVTHDGTAPETTMWRRV